MCRETRRSGFLRPARRRWMGVQRDKSLWRCLRKTARRAGERNSTAVCAGAASSVPPAGDGWESRGTSPSGAVCARPLAAQADKTARLHERKNSLMKGVFLT